MSQSDAARRYQILASVVLAIGLAAACYQVLAPFLAAIAWAGILSVAFRTPYAWLERKMPRRRSLAAALGATAIALLVLLPAALLLAAVIGQAVEAFHAVSVRLKSGDFGPFSELFSGPRVDRFLAAVQERTGLAPEDFRQRAGELIGQVSRALAQGVGSAALGLLGVVGTFLMTMFLLFFGLRDGPALVGALAEVLPVAAPEREKLLGSFRGMLQAIFRGSFLSAAAQGLTGGIGWAIAGLPSPVLAGAGMSILSFLPIGGTALVWLPGAVACWLTGRPGLAVFLAVWGLVVVSFLADNVLKPILIGGAGELDTLTVFLGVFGGIAAFGFLGVFLGPMALAAGAILLQALRALGRRASEPALPDPAPPEAASG